MTKGRVRFIYGLSLCDQPFTPNMSQYEGGWRSLLHVLPCYKVNSTWNKERTRRHLGLGATQTYLTLDKAAKR